MFKQPEQIFVNAGMVIAPLPGVVIPAQQIADVSNSLLLAQLSARAKYSLAAQQVERERACQTMLDNLYWIRLNEPYFALDGVQTLSIDAVVATQTGGLFTADVTAGFVALIASLKTSPPSERALAVWREQTVRPLHTEHLESTECPVPDRFQVCVKFALMGVGPVLHTLMLSFTTHTVLATDFLNQTLVTDPESKLVLQAYSYELSGRNYANLRGTVVKKLGDKPEQYVMPWACVQPPCQPPGITKN